MPKSAKPKPDGALDTGHLRSDLKARAVSGMMVTVLTQAGKLILHIAYIAVMSRLLPPGDFGLIAMITSITSILGVIRDGGLTTATIQRPEITQQEVSGMFWFNVAFGVLLALATAALAPALAWFYKAPLLGDVVLLYALTFVAAGFIVQHEAIIRRNMRFRALAATEIITLIVSSCTGVAFAGAGFGYWAIAFAAVAGSITNVILLWAISGWRPGLPSWSTGVRQMLTFGGHVMTFNLVSALGMNLDKILLGRFYGPDSLGFYSRAQALLMQPFTQVLAPLGSVAIPTLSRVNSEPAKFQETVLRLLLIVGFVSAFTSAFIFSGANWIVRLLLGEGWSPTATILRAFAITVFTMPISVVATWTLTTAGLGKDLSYWGVVNNAILLAAVVCGLYWGPLGVAFAFSLSGIFIRVPLLYFYVARKTDIELGRIISVVRPAFIAFALLSTCLYGISHAIGTLDPLPGLSVLCLSTLLLAAVILSQSAWGQDVWRTVRALTPIRRSVSR